MLSRRSTLTWAFTLTLNVIASAPALAQAGDQWEDTSEMSMGGVSMGPMTRQRCSARNSDTLPMGETDRNCETYDVQRSATGITWKVRCTGAHAGSGSGEMRFEGRDRYRGSMTMQSDGQTMTMKLAGRRIGDCDLAQARRQEDGVRQTIAAAQAQADQAKAMQCRSSVDNMMPYFLRPEMGLGCEAKFKGELCAKLQTREGFATVAARRGAASPGAGQGDLAEVAGFCGVNGADLRTRLCTQAEQQEALDFLASGCLGQGVAGSGAGGGAGGGFGKAIIARECAGRSYSSPPAEKYRNFCSSAAREGLMQADASRSGKPGTAAPAPAPAASTPPTTARQDALEKGKELLKGLLGR
jgi:Protein of unknown function (DUF3617)